MSSHTENKCMKPFHAHLLFIVDEEHVWCDEQGNTGKHERCAIDGPTLFVVDGCLTAWGAFTIDIG